ncbi:MAG: phenylalanine--tRNA ligase subunit beta [Candidatus Desulfofervidus auxilii]|nr:phenylalanine--tRNA ligase subunit beta [Candidatus Desulfofervidus auxilii]
MRIPLNWLKEFVEINCSPEELAEKLTMTGLEVEEILEPYNYLKKVIIGKVESVSPHPQAKKLSLCSVSTGNATYNVVCGAPNVKKGIKAPLAIPGCLLPSGQEVKAIKIRGIISEGMLCSQKELGVGEDHSGIWILPDDFPLGINLAKALLLDDTVFEIAITPNRGDCLSILGIAREIAAILRLKLNYPQYEIKETGISIDKEFKVTIENPEHCFRYVARLIRNVKIKPSPLWMQARLLLAGLRPINNIVDITNYVMLEYGQPLHAFDAKKINEKHIIVRLAKPNEKLITLDGKEQMLKETDLLICDKNGPIALAGIMGGMNSEISSETTDVLLESAYFHPITIRRTAKRLNIITESSYRFEREVDPEGTYLAAQRAAYFMQELAEGNVAKGTIDVYPSPKYPPVVNIRISKVKEVLGAKISKKEIMEILKALKVNIKDKGEILEVMPPSYRHDLEREIDFIEEIARLYGYEKIPSTMPILSLEARPIPLYQRWREKIKDILCGLGWHEIITYAFIDPKVFDKLRLPNDSYLRKTIKLLNPLTSDRAVMRTTLLPGLLEACDINQRQRIYHFRLFELGKVFFDIGKDLPKESYHLGGILSGYHFDPSWHFRLESADFYDLKGAVESLIEAIGLKNVRFEPADLPYLHPANATWINSNNEKIGYLGEIHPEVKEAWDLKRTAFIFELDLEKVFQLIEREKQFKPLPKYPSSERDVSLVVPEDFSAQKINDFVLNLKIPEIEDIFLIDVYQGPPLEKEKKSLTFRLIYRAFDHTLTDEEVDKLHNNIVQSIIKQFKINVRQ